MLYALDTVMDLVKNALDDPVVEDALSQHGIDNVATSGVKIVTTVDKNIQNESLYALRKELSRLDIQLQGYERQKLQTIYGQVKGGDREPRGGSFLFGRITAIEKAMPPVIYVAFSERDEMAADGIIDQKGLMNALVPLAKYQKSRWTEAGYEDLPLLLGQLRQGDRVYVSIREVDALTGKFVLDLEKYPEIQGGLLALKDGTIRAMIGGMENQFYNRTIHAKRSMGSIFKPLVYCAAMQLGWSSVDLLNNERNLFQYQKTSYFPRPDHKSPFDWVSMTWAGALSENVATVWLLYHLCDQLSPAQFKEVITYLGLDLKPDESYQQYRQRIRDTYGVVVNAAALYKAAFKRAVDEMGPDLIFEGRLKEYEALRDFHYGVGDIPIDDDASLETEAVRRRVLKKDFVRLQKLLEDLNRLRDLIDNPQDHAVAGNLYRKLIQSPGVEDSRKWFFNFTEEIPEEGWQRVSWSEIRSILEAMTETQRQQFWDTIVIDDLLPAERIKILKELIDKEYNRLASLPPYEPEVLHNITDFRVLVSLQYLIGLCRAVGIESNLDPVLSFPLGSNVISLFETARAYETMTQGSIWQSDSEDANPGFHIIERIEDSDGEIIFAPQFTRKKTVDLKSSMAINSILRNVVKHGTGRSAGNTVRLHSLDVEKERSLRELDLRIPLAGKTGTANNFTNSSFVGVIPDIAEKESTFSLANGYVVAAYVGFDDNKPMTHAATRISGAAGALPIWIRVANAILLEEDYAARLDLVDMSFAGSNEAPLSFPDGKQIYVRLDGERGGAAAVPQRQSHNADQGGKIMPVEGAVTIAYGTVNSRGEFEPARYFQPYWKMQED